MIQPPQVTSATDFPKAALVVAHPGHELRVFHWMEKCGPLFFCITDGSGREGKSRVGSTESVLQAVGGTPGSIYGRFTDKDVYKLLLEGRVEVFAQLLPELADAFIREQIGIVVGDSPEGMNPTHDICRYLIDAAVAAAEQVTGRIIANYEFALDAPPNLATPELQSRSLWLHLDEEAFQRKLQAALGYTELKAETEAGLKIFGEKAYAVECLVPSTGAASLERFMHEVPAYEHYGREGVTRFGQEFGKYKDVITFREHVLPVAHAIGAAARDYASSHLREAGNQNC